MHIYLMRHGETFNNVAGVFNGQSEDTLTPAGIAQAEKTALALGNIRFDKVYCSPQTRARMTAEIVNKDRVPTVYFDGLKERNTAGLTGTPYSSVDMERYWNYYAPRTADAETPAELLERVSAVIRTIISGPEENVLVVTHNGVIRAFGMFFYGIPSDGALRHYHVLDNCAFSVFDTDSISDLFFEKK